MRVTAIGAKTQRKRLDRSAHRAEKRRCRARMLRVHSMIRRAPSVWATTDTAQGEKCLFNQQNQAILMTDGSPLGECRIRGVSEMLADQGRAKLPPPPPVAHRKPETRPSRGPFFFLFQRGLAKPPDFRRLAIASKLVSERPASLSVCPTSRSRRIKNDELSACWRNCTAPQLKQVRLLTVRTETPQGGVLLRKARKAARSPW